MAHIESSGGGRKTNFEPNLVPFIDLMSVLITFLLITAVWSQVSMIQIGSSLYGKKSDTQPPPSIEEEQNLVLKLEIRATGYLLTVGRQAFNIPKVEGEFDHIGLFTHLQKVKGDHPNKKDAVILMADELPYEMLINGMDNLLKSGFTAISVATGGPN
jgi:biopolymer transport protein ExbD